jgi:hypothetical protein
MVCQLHLQELAPCIRWSFSTPVLGGRFAPLERGGLNRRTDGRTERTSSAGRTSAGRRGEAGRRGGESPFGAWAARSAVLIASGKLIALAYKLALRHLIEFALLPISKCNQSPILPDPFAPQKYVRHPKYGNHLVCACYSVWLKWVVMHRIARRGTDAWPNPIALGGLYGSMCRMV